MIESTENICSTNDLANSNTLLTNSLHTASWMDKKKNVFKKIKSFLREITVEPCMFMYMMCSSLSSLAVQNMHLEKTCRVYFNFGDDICDRIRDLNTTGLEQELNQVQITVAQVIAWKSPLQTAIPAVMVLFVGAWSDKYKKRKICILLPFIGEILANIGLIIATYYFNEVSLISTVLIETLPTALTGNFVIITMGMTSFMADRTTIEDRTFRLGIVTIFVSFGTPTGTSLSGILLRALGYYGLFSLLIVLYSLSFLYGLVRLEDKEKIVKKEPSSKLEVTESRFKMILRSVFGLLKNTFLVVLRPRALNGRVQIFIVLILLLLMVGPMHSDGHFGYLYARRQFQLNEVEYSIYGTINILLGLVGIMFCMSVLSKKLKIQDSAIGGLAGFSRIAACFVIAFAPNRRWYYAAPLFNMFSYGGIPTIRSIATKSVLTDEVAKVSALIGVMDALAPSIYVPISSYIYANTIETFPGAIYMFDVIATVAALGLLVVIYVFVRRRMRDDPKKNEEFPMSNEISQF